MRGAVESQDPGYQGSWLNRAATVLSRTYLVGLVALAFAAGAPLMLGWTAAVDLTPTGEDQSRGGVILAAPPGVAGFHSGARLLVDVDGSGQLSVRTLAEVRPDGRLALASEGALPRVLVAADAVEGVRKAEVPLIGLPVVWWRTGHQAYTASWVVATLLAFVSATTTGPTTRSERRRSLSARQRRAAAMAPVTKS